MGLAFFDWTDGRAPVRSRGCKLRMGINNINKGALAIYRCTRGILRKAVQPVHHLHRLADADPIQKEKIRGSAVRELDATIRIGENPAAKRIIS